MFKCINDNSFNFNFDSYLHVLSTDKLDQFEFYNSSINISLNVCKDIEVKTRLQSKNSFWFAQREYRLTSSNFGTFCKLRESTDPMKTFLQKKLYFTSPSVRHSLENESLAFAKYVEKVNDVTHCPVGLVIHPDLPFIGASPDRLVYNSNSKELKLIEIKCPYSFHSKKTKIFQHVDLNTFILKRQADGTLALKDTHNYFYQIQGQLTLRTAKELKGAQPG
ncbi:hypothetical protein SNE40_009573 [Patella caerulea]|uniref:YqaJ viral recombinase domain-containing protein n=1 Tax=Patella caerulea TaxID=87958 RepID=A0AAN8JVR2_PATCE